MTIKFDLLKKSIVKYIPNNEVNNTNNKVKIAPNNVCEPFSFSY